VGDGVGLGDGVGDKVGVGVDDGVGVAVGTGDVVSSGWQPARASPEVRTTITRKYAASCNIFLKKPVPF